MRVLWAVVGRELRLASRRGAMWRLRVSAGAVAALALVFCFYLGALGGGGMTSGRTLFSVIGAGCGLWAMLAGCQKTADSLGRERREGTLGLLFLTDLKGWDVVLGKMAAAGWETFYQLLAVVPVLAIPLLLGGITLSEVGLLVLALTNCLVLSLAFGMAGSLWSRDPRQAVGLAAALILAVTVFPGGIFIFLVAREHGLSEAQAFPVLMPSPAVPFIHLLPSMPPGIPSWLPLGSVVLQSVLSFGLLKFMAGRVRTIWQFGTGRGWRVRWAEFRDRIRFGPLAVRERRRRQLLDQGAWVWLSRRERWKKALPWVLVLSMLGIELWIDLAVGYRYVATEGTAMIPLVFHWLMRMWVATESVQALAEQRSSGALELLLTTPLNASEILIQQRRTLVSLLAWPWGILLLNDLVVLFWFHSSGESNNYSVAWWMHLAAFLSSPVHAYGMRWISTWNVLLGRPPNQAVGRALRSVLFLPGVAGGVLAFSVATLAEKWEVEFNARVALCTILWLAVQYVWVGWWGARTAAKARTQFQQQVTSQAGREPRDA